MTLRPRAWRHDLWLADAYQHFEVVGLETSPKLLRELLQRNLAFALCPVGCHVGGYH